MFTQGLVALVAVAFAGQTLAAVAPYNRNPLEKKDLKLVTVVTTEVKWVTVTEYEGQAPTAAPTFYTHSRRRKSKSSVVEAPASAPAPPAPAVPTTIITRTRASVAPAPSSSAAPAPAPPPAPPAPVPAPPVSSAVPPPPPPPSPAPAPPAAAPEPVAPPPAPPAAPPAPAPAPPAPKPAPPPPAPKPIATGTKRGLPYNKPELLRSLVDSGSKVSWTYNWGQRDDSGLDIEFCPMLWGMKLDFAQTWPANAQRAIDAGSKCLLSFNEPDLGSQANMSPEEAARRHIELMNPFAGKALIGSPAVTNSGDANQGIQYLQKWVNACAGRCHFDFVVIHIYGFDTRTFLEHLRKVHNMFNKPIWITEFAFNGSEEEINRQLSEVLTTIDSEMPFVERLSYFMVENGMLVNGNSPTRYGNTFAYGA